MVSSLRTEEVLRGIREFFGKLSDAWANLNWWITADYWRAYILVLRGKGPVQKGIHLRWWDIYWHKNSGYNGTTLSRRQPHHHHHDHHHTLLSLCTIISHTNTKLIYIPPPLPPIYQYSHTFRLTITHTIITITIYIYANKY